jgi:hypothetical protein
LRVSQDFCSFHAGSVRVACGVEFRVALPKSSRLSRRAVAAKHRGFAHLRVARESSSAEGVVFELFAGFLENMGW